jgi:Zn-dependent protease
MRAGALRLFRVFGIDVYLHFTWFIVAAFYVMRLAQRYHSPVWGLLEYLALFGIVLLHEFGHALACRQTGGIADHIVLWPLGGIAFVRPPPRPGAYLWSLAAGPLVNVILLPFFLGLTFVAVQGGWRYTSPDAYQFVVSVAYINAGLLIFNLLPVYPLDGGQIVRGILWFFIGPIRSLKIASFIGFIGAAAFALWAFRERSIWLGILAFFVFGQAQMGWRAAQQLALDEETARAQAAVSPPPIPPDRGL